MAMGVGISIEGEGPEREDLLEHLLSCLVNPV